MILNDIEWYWMIYSILNEIEWYTVYWMKLNDIQNIEWYIECWMNVMRNIEWDIRILNGCYVKYWMIVDVLNDIEGMSNNNDIVRWNVEW